MDLLEALPTVIGTAAVAPALLMLWLVIAAGDRPGPATRVWSAFFLGAASILVLGPLRAPFAAMAGSAKTPWLAEALHSRVVVAAPEECLKILVIVAVSARRRPFADPLDTILYGAAAGLGFAAYENLAYLMQHAEIWRSLAVLRSVLTVPFHGALGIIAGAYLALARSGTALGAHRHHRDGARLSNLLLLVLAPLVLHAAFDFPLLTLRQNPDLDAASRFMLGALSIAIGFGSIVIAIRLVRRVGHHHSPRTATARARLSQLRRMWALWMLGGFAGFLGLAFLLGSVHHWLLNPERNMAFVLVPLGLVAILMGGALLLVTAAIYLFGRHRIRSAEGGFSTAPGGG